MKLKVYNKTNSCLFRPEKPFVRLSLRAGLFSFHKGAIGLMELVPGDRLIVCNDEESPRDWYIHKTADPEGFELKVKGANIAHILQFNSAILVSKILASAGVAQKASFTISKTPVGIHGMEYWPLITANPMGAL